jgi:hypothetical protein
MRNKKETTEIPKYELPITNMDLDLILFSYYEKRRIFIPVASLRNKFEGFS